VNILEQVAAQISAADKLKTAIGMALTPEQQIAVSAKIAGGPDVFVFWSHTDEGRAAIRELADRFTGVTP
jgi:hypothetical protein